MLGIGDADREILAKANDPNGFLRGLMGLVLIIVRSSDQEGVESALDWMNWEHDLEAVVHKIIVATQKLSLDDRVSLEQSFHRI